MIRQRFAPMLSISFAAPRTKRLQWSTRECDEEKAVFFVRLRCLFRTEG